MEGNKTSQIIQQIYGHETVEEKEGFFKGIFLGISRWLGEVLGSLNNQHYRILKITVVLSTIFVSLCIILTIYYYNKFTYQHYNVLESMAKVESILERRRNITVNLSQLVLDYSNHEKNVFSGVLNSRKLFAVGNAPTKTESGPETLTKASTTTDLLSKLFALAEQYPDLKLGQNFLKFTDALVEIEKVLDAANAEYNAKVNLLTTAINTFPGNFFNLFLGFKSFNYFKASEDARKFWKVSY
ncbi:MAG: LemA family protein [Oligoflexia bacterium]|nr:LemA family protein [Oligoflexia bacterium]